MPLPPKSRAVKLTIDEWRQLDWIEGRRGGSWHARICQLVRDYLHGKEKPPAYFGVPLSNGEQEA